MQGGLWDPEDDCCEPRCLESHPCQEGEGACTGDSGCADSHFFFCGAGSCHNSQLVPREVLHRNLLSLSVGSPARCCVRRCHPSHLLCSYGQTGCLLDSDCEADLYCNTQLGLHQDRLLIELKFNLSTLCLPGIL